MSGGAASDPRARRRRVARDAWHGYAASVSDRPPKRDRRTEDRKLLQAVPYADTSFLETDAWRALRIIGEFVDGFDALARLGPAVTIFGSARTGPDDPTYVAARRLGGSPRG